ncbi:MAG: aldehyde dehydrogenase (NAD(P)(+)) ald5 [Chaenotheca gracillima]|nr:MAG: aldehyde dehydrogenase (NAD(P)(+)) ald5 [Chaenotheca gracillima]
MSVGQVARPSSRSQGSGRSRAGTGDSQASVVTNMDDLGKAFEPCAATASMFLYAQGPAILCLHHDTLDLDRRFQRHTEDILFIAVDNVTERGAGRQVVSYDSGQTAIVWDLFTGDEIARFASYERICVAQWMRNGNVAFGNIQGNVILFEPSTSEHIAARTIFDPITALAPAADCSTYAIGYMNGSILIATLQPSFTILHTLTTPRAPSPIVGLAWHASSSKQKSDMLATQTEDGDLRVWSVSKAHSEPPKVVRVLRRSDNYKPGPNWLAWSKNGRVIQHTEGESFSWDVRTKHVSYEPIPTLDMVNGLAVYGATATLFTLGRNHTVQQFELGNPPTLVANKQHPPPIPPPSPPVSIEDAKASQGVGEASSSTNVGARPVNRRPRGESDTAEMSPLQKITSEMDQMEEARKDRNGAFSPSSTNSRSRAPSISSKSSASAHRHHYRSNASVSSKATSNEGTLFSMGSSSMMSGRESASIGQSAPSVASSSRSRPRGSRLKQEVLRSPDEKQLHTDLFPFVRGRLSDVPYKNPQIRDIAALTASDLRRQMLSVVFGWEDDVEALIQDELRHHSPGSASAVLLSKWLGDVDADMMASMVGSQTMTSSDWMLLALSSMGGQNSTKKVGEAFVQRLLEKGDIHAAATILLGLGEQNDAVEVYVSHHLYMEAVLLACLVFPNDWQRQSELVRKWGTHAVQHAQQHLAIRCFSCTGTETLAVLTSPRAQDSVQPQPPRIVSPPLSPPAGRSSRILSKNASLKLITTFGEKAEPAPNGPNQRFFGLGDDARTPMNGAGVTPIAESAISPGGAHPFGRSNQRTANLPESARTATPGGYGRLRLPSIGETPLEETPRAVVKPRALPTPVDSGSDKEKNMRARQRSDSRPSSSDAPLTLSAARFDPRDEARSPMSQVSKDSLPSPAHHAFANVKSNSRNGSRDRKPDGLQIQWPPMESIITGDYMSPGSDVSGHRRGYSRSNTSSSVAGSSASQSSRKERRERRDPPDTARSLASSVQSPPMTGKSMDKYISSLEEAQHYARQKDESRRHPETRNGRSRRGSIDEVGPRGRSSGRKAKTREPSQDRGRDGSRYIKPAKRSPSSPVPMSPDDLRNYSTESYDDERYYGVNSPVNGPSLQKERSRRPTASSRTRAEVSEPLSARRISPDRQAKGRAGSTLGARIISRGASRQASRQTSPNSRDGRGRSQLRADGAIMRSPSSPLPMSPQARLYRDDDDDEAERQAAAEERRRFRTQRSSSRKPQDRAQSRRREESVDRRRRDQSLGRTTRQDGASTRRDDRDDGPGVSSQDRVRELRHKKSEKTIRKESAARELEERRKSLARRPSAPPIPTPTDLSSYNSPLSRYGDGLDSPSSWKPVDFEPPQHVPNRSKTTSPSMTRSIHHPTTPRAMRHPRDIYGDSGEQIPEVPEVPNNLSRLDVREESKDDGDLDTLGGLPSTVYAPPPRIKRSMSVPIPEEPSSPPPLPAGLPTHPAFQAALPPSSRSRSTAPFVEGGSLPTTRKVNQGECQPGTLGYESRNHISIYASPQPVMFGIDETIQASNQPVTIVDVQHPPLLPELQHLAQPPPPPPPPLVHAPPSHFRSHSRTNSVVTTNSGTSSGVINIGIEGQSRGGSPAIDVRSLSPPMPGHSRGRSANETLSGKLSRATQRMRSGSRSRNKSPPMERMPAFENLPVRQASPYESIAPPPGQAPTYQSIPVPPRHASPYESIPPPPPPPPPPPFGQHEVPVRSHTVSPNLERHPREVRADMSRNQFTAGGMI